MESDVRRGLDGRGDGWGTVARPAGSGSPPVRWPTKRWPQRMSKESWRCRSMYRCCSAHGSSGAGRRFRLRSPPGGSQPTTSMGHGIAERVEGCAAADVREESRERLGRRLKSHLDPDGLIRSSAKNGRRRLRRGRAATSRAECPQRPGVQCHLAFPAGLTFGLARTVDLTRDSPAPTNRTARRSESPRTTTRPRILLRLKRPSRRTERPRQQGCCRPTRSRRGTIGPMTLPNAPACADSAPPPPMRVRGL